MDDKEILVTIMHISDTHFSERLVEPAGDQVHLPRRYGHDVRAFLALDRLLRDTEWDVLVLSGDVSRVGRDDSFVWARNWLENQIDIDDLNLGLNLSKNPDRHYALVPGNHDRFNGGLLQGGVDKFDLQFPTVKAGTIQKFKVRGLQVNLHLFDSSFDGGKFALGRLNQTSLEPRNIVAHELDIAVLHHHFIQPPEHGREYASELQNAADVCGYLIASRFDAVLFGHTHKSYLDYLPVKLVASLIGRKRIRNKVLRRIFPKWILKQFEGENPVNYHRERARNGQFPTMESYLRYRYLRNQLGEGVNGPRGFQNIKQFYGHLEEIESNLGLGEESPPGFTELLSALKSEKLLVSMAPSACQAEADKNGVHRLQFSFLKGRLVTVGWEVFALNKARFELVREGPTRI